MSEPVPPQFLPLGYQRLRVLGCLMADWDDMPGYFKPPAANVDIFVAFREHVTRLSQKWKTQSDPYPYIATNTLAAARLLTGDLAAADVIVDHLPIEPHKLDHGAGYCLVLPFQVLNTSLPLPAELHDIDCWLADSPEQTALRSWLATHRDRLRWVEDAAIYQLD